MPTVAELLALNKAGATWLIDVSFDDFASVSYRWSTASVTVSGNDYDGRIVDIDPITRGFGRDHLPAASTTNVTIGNSDFAMDWMTDRSTVATQVLQARFKLSLHLWDSRAYATAADTLSAATQTLGIYTCLDQPVASASSVTLTLSDDSLGRLAEPLVTPTVRDWKDAPLAALNALDTNPYASGGPVPAMDWDVPLPLVFGLGTFGLRVPAYLGIAGYESYPGPIRTAIDIYRRGLADTVAVPLVVCAAKSGNANFRPSDTEITALYGTYRDDVVDRTNYSGVTLRIPRSFEMTVRKLSGVAGQRTEYVDTEIWRPRRSQVITKSGREWQVVWISFNVDHYAEWFLQKKSQLPAPIPGQTTSVTPALGVNYGLPVYYVPGALAAVAQPVDRQSNRISIMSAFESFSCTGSPFSTVTTMTDAEGRRIASPRLVDQLHDAIAYYSKASESDMDTTAWQRARVARNSVLGGGIIQPSRPRPLESAQPNSWLSPNPRDGVVGVLMSALGDMSSSCDVDVFATKEGKYSVATNALDYTAATASHTDIDESRIRNVTVRTPSHGERWAPYNRVFVTGPGGSAYGPFDNNTAITSWGRVLPITINGKWNLMMHGEAAALVASTVWDYRTLESKVRPAIRFVASREYLSLELGDLFTFTWTRGGVASVFGGTLFRVEELRVDAASLSVEVGAVWVQDMADDEPYLLDDENFIVRVSSSAGRTATVTDSSPTVQFSSGDLQSDGVAVGDILILKDATQAENVYSRHRALRIIEVTGATGLRISDSDLDFSAPAGAAVSVWTIRRGKTTYHTAATDPANYPNGSAMYGKACDTSDQFSDSTAANKLLDG